MTGTARTRRAADLLLQARATRSPLRTLPADARPQSTDEAYAIQDLVIAALGPIGAWKVGAKTPSAEPNCAPLCATWRVDAPARFAAGTFRLNGIEAELAFTLDRDLPARDRRYGRQEAVEAVASVHTAIEVVDSRFADIGEVDALSLLADSNSHGALVVGPGVPLSASFAVIDQVVELDSDGVRLASGRDANPAGDPFRLLAWLANHAAQRGGGLRRGQAVTTGSWTGLRFVQPGARVSARFPGVGEAVVHL
ncbi:MAG TPA: fumarylacetoacetate hydrolase family protein [Casimicrobiaceae bacterium]